MPDPISIDRWAKGATPRSSLPEATMAHKRRKVAKSDRPQKRAHGKRQPSGRFESVRKRATKPTRTSVRSHPGAPGRRAPATGKKGRRPVPRAVPRAPVFDALSVAELVEACRTHVVTLMEFAGVTKLRLFDCYRDEGDGPELWQCCNLVRRVLDQVDIALMPLSFVSDETAPLSRAAEIAKGCKAQTQWLRPAVHVIRATLYNLKRVDPHHHGPFLLALRDLAHGIVIVISGLERVIQRCPLRSGSAKAIKDAAIHRRRAVM